MAKKTKVKLVADRNGWKIDTDKLAGKVLSDKQAKILVMQHFAEVLDVFCVSVNRLADTLKDAKFHNVAPSFQKIGGSGK